MDHVAQLCQDHRMLVYLIAGVLLFAGIGMGLLAKILIPSIIGFFKKTPPVEVNVAPENGHNGTYCELCPEHPNFQRFVQTMKDQQTKNMEMITEIRLTQENNLAVISEITRQQSKMWERLDSIPSAFGEIKGQLGRIQGMIETLHAGEVRRRT